MDPVGTSCEQCVGEYVAGAPIRVDYGPNAVRLRRTPGRINGVFGAYVLLDALGSGGMGDVYLGLDPRSGQFFALKLVRADGARQRTVQMLEHEAALQARIVHPNVVRVFSLERGPGGALAIVQEVVWGSSLEHLIGDRTGRPFDEAEVLWFAEHMARGLAVAHAHNYVHADLKPGNFLLGRSDSGPQSVKLADFGIARSVRAACSWLEGRLTGTPGYMSPEQFGRQTLTPASDLYSLGCVLYEMVTGEPVFALGDLDALKRAHTSVAPTPTAARRRGVRPDLAALIDGLLAKSADDRGFTDASGVLDAILEMSRGAR